MKFSTTSIGIASLVLTVLGRGGWPMADSIR
jgi:hypothetical protein